MEKFSVRSAIGHHFVHVFKANQNQDDRVFVACQSGICSKRYRKLVNFYTMDEVALCSHLAVFKVYLDSHWKNHRLLRILRWQNIPEEEEEEEEEEDSDETEDAEENDDTTLDCEDEVDFEVENEMKNEVENEMKTEVENEVKPENSTLPKVNPISLFSFLIIVPVSTRRKEAVQVPTILRGLSPFFF